MNYGWITNNVVDLWTKPHYNSERASQLLFGEPLTVIGSQNGFLDVTQADGYRGWVDKRFAQLLSKTDFISYAKSMNAVLIRPQTRIYSDIGKTGTAPFLLYYGTKLAAGRSTKGQKKIHLPDGRYFYVKNDNLAPINDNKAGTTTGKTVVREAKKFIGVPYLWGGVTATGFDCSGLVQTVLKRFGIYVPRDTKDQITIGQAVRREEIIVGDLLFFARHVGFAIDANRLIHSSVGGGGVRINSLKAGDIDYREDLDRDFNQGRRILCFS